MRELIVAEKEISDERGRIRRYTYSVLIDEMDVGTFSCESYGVKIEEKETGRVAVVPHVTVRADRIDGLMELLTDHVVTPIGLRDVIEDWL